MCGIPRLDGGDRVRLRRDRDRVREKEESVYGGGFIFFANIDGGIYNIYFTPRYIFVLLLLKKKKRTALHGTAVCFCIHIYIYFYFTLKCFSTTKNTLSADERARLLHRSNARFPSISSVYYTPSHIIHRYNGPFSPLSAAILLY